MEENAFVGCEKPPSEKVLAAALGKSHKVWVRLLAELTEIAPSHEWHSYSKKAGWSLKVKRGERVILYLAPCKGSFRASFALGEIAIEAAKKSGLPKNTIELIQAAKKYAEGTAVRFENVTDDNIEVIKKLAIAKANN